MTPVSELLAAILSGGAFHKHLPQHRRLFEAIKLAIRDGQLSANMKLPASRTMADDLGVSRNTVVAAYEQLAADSFVHSIEGSGTYVRQLPELAGTPIDSEAGQPAQNLRLSQRALAMSSLPDSRILEIQPFVVGQMDFSGFPLKLWQRLQNRIWRELRPELLDYAQAGGYQPLRRALADYLRISRSVRVRPEQVVITAGTQQSLDVCAQLLADHGDLVWIENPCYWGARKIFQARDLVLRPIAVDAEGIRLSEQDLQSTPRLIYVTPSHQYPTGAVMSLARRAELLAVAARKQAWILEDDYDSEFRYSGRPLSSLQGLDMQQRVIYLGTFSKVLYPGIKMSYLVLPACLVPAFNLALYDLHRPGQLPMQAALAEFLELGYFETHLRRMRQSYGAKRELLRRLLVSGLQQYDVVISNEESGLHLLIELPDGVDDRAIASKASWFDLQLFSLSAYYLVGPARSGLLVGYAYVKPEKILHYGELLVNLIVSELPKINCGSEQL